MYSYRMIGRSEETPDERPLAILSVEAVAIRLQTDDVPEVFFIKEDVNGYIKFPSQINGYCLSGGKYISICCGRPPRDLVRTVIHEMKHVHQALDPKWIARSTEMAERDARLFEIEFWGSRSSNGDAATLMRTLDEIIKADLELLWKQACSFARAQLSKPTSDSDRLRAQFAPVLKARSLSVQRFIDPNNSRQLFPDNIEFSCPRSTTLTVSYHK
jgi:hypothetical protein